MATMVRDSRREKRPVENRRELDRTRSVREVSLVGTAPGEPGAFLIHPPQRIALEGREYQVIAAQNTANGGYLHLSSVDTGAGAGTSAR